jgi:hypothetical protein
MAAAPYNSPFTDQLDAIPNEARLYRLILPQWVDWDSPAVNGPGPRFKRLAFQDYRKEDAERLGYEGPCLSVALGRILDELALDPNNLPALHAVPETYGVAWFTAEAARKLAAGAQGLMLRPEPNLPWHTIVFCMAKDKKSEAMQKGLAAAAHWLRLAARVS